MANKLYKTPLPLERIFLGQELPTTSLYNSIDQALETIITTRFGEHRFDPTFGCEIWNLDFELIVSEGLWEEKLRQSMLNSIKLHEPRLSNALLQVKISEVPHQHYSLKSAQIKKQVDIKITGSIIKTGEPYTFSSKLYLSPLSVTY